MIGRFRFYGHGAGLTVADSALRRRPLEHTAQMTSGTIDLLVRPRQRKTRQQMIILNRFDRRIASGRIAHNNQRCHQNYQGRHVYRNNTDRYQGFHLPAS